MNPWTFRQEFARSGENSRVPIQIIATPRNFAFSIEVFLTTLSRDFKNAIYGYVREYARSRGSRVNDSRLENMEIFIYPTSIRNNGREMRRPSGAVKVKDISPSVFEEVLEQVQSEEEGQISDYFWSAILNPTKVKAVCIGGRGGDGPPKFLKTLHFKSTWYTQRDANGPINCAAYALATFHSTHGCIFRENKPAPALKASRLLQTKLRYGEFASIADIETFVNKFPVYRVCILVYVRFNQESSFCTSFTGSLYAGEEKFTCYLVLYENHWALTKSFDRFLKQATNNASRLYYCKDFVHLSKSRDCHTVAVKKPKLEKYPCLAPQCNGEVHQDKCPFMKCKSCQVYMGSSDHRCILLPKGMGKPPPHEQYWNGSLYNFETEEDGDGETTAYFAYDLETMIVKTSFNESHPRNLVTPAYDENFQYPAMDEKVFSSEYNSMVPNLVVLTNIYSSKVPTSEGEPSFAPKLVRFHGPNCMEQFLIFATKFNKGNNVFVAHNGSGFDSKFVYAESIKLKIPNSHILRGTNFVSLTLGGSRSQKTRFIDSMLHLPGSLSGLADGFFGKSPDKSLRESLTKGYFPHSFNTVENQNYIGPIPDIKYFNLENSKLGGGARKYDYVLKIQEWHKKQQGKVWNFKEELIKYCDIDVVILAALLQTYMGISIPKGAIPLDFTTSPAFVHEVILLKATKNVYLPDLSKNAISRELKGTVPKDELATLVNQEKASRHLEYESLMKEYLKSYWAILKEPEYHFVRKALRGGRTEIRDRLMRLTPEEEALGIKIVYQDVTSLYPAMQLTKEFPCGIPQINYYDYSFKPCINCFSKKDSDREYITECDCLIKGYGGSSLDLVDCTAFQPPLSEIMDDSFFGYVCVTLTPPKDLYHPVVQIKKTRNKSTKCENNLVDEDHEKIYLDTPTFKHALMKGYVLNRVHRFDKYNKSKGHWVEAGMEFFVDKERTSGPKPSTTERGMYCTEFEKEFPNAPQPLCERDAYVALYNYLVPSLGDRLAQSMDTEEWSKQPAQRQVYKIFNNCGWGKHAQRPVMPQSQTFDSETQCQEIATLFENVSKGLYNLKGCIVFNEGKSIMYSWENTEKCNVNLHNSYLPAGAMVPAYGRLTLLSGLEIVGENLAMCDTDSTVYKSSVDPLKNIPFSSLLGRFKEEDISEDGIIEFVGFGPKCYSIKTKKMVDVKMPDGSTLTTNLTYTKLKGIRQTVGCAGIDHDFMVRDMERYLSTGEVNVTSVPQWGIKTKLNNNGTPLVYTLDYLKDFKLMGGDDMKGFHIKGDSKLYPFGYEI